ncbi:MAG: glycerol kinase [Phenylobacterium sp.]|jgi:glycerol kinase
MILAIDQGTTGSTAIIFNADGQMIARTYSEFNQIYPQASWVEHDPMEIWQVTLDTIIEAISKAHIKASEIKSIGITNQRETTVLWDKTSGLPVHNAIVWQCRRSSDICQQIKADGKAPWIQQKTGLVVDAYFSASKIKWIFDHHPDIKQQANEGKLAFGTIDSWLIWNLTGGNSHVTDHTNASRTLLYNIHDHGWDEELLAFFDIPTAILPQIQASAGDFGSTRSGLFEGKGFEGAGSEGAGFEGARFEGVSISINGVAGDQQAALFGQGCVNPGEVKNTYGTGCFMLMQTGDKAVTSDNGLLTTIACNASGQPSYALEGSVFMAGAAVQWLRDEMGLISKANETEAIAQSIPDTAGVYVVPAFTGLGAPHWDMNARGAIVGLTRGSGKKHIVRATLEAIAWQTRDVLQLMEQESKVKLKALKVDGGACANNFLMQFQSDILDLEIIRPNNVDSTALGAALLAGIGAGLWQAGKLPKGVTTPDRQFTPAMDEDSRQQQAAGWATAVARVVI